MSVAQPGPSDHPVVRYLSIAAITTVIAVVAVAAPGSLIGLVVLVAPFVLVGLATDADGLDLAADSPGPFGPELRVLPTI